LDHWRSRRNRVYRTPRVGRSHFGGGGSGSRSAVPTYPQPPHKWTTSPDSGRTGGSLPARRIAFLHWGSLRRGGALEGNREIIGDLLEISLNRLLRWAAAMQGHGIARAA